MSEKSSAESQFSVPPLAPILDFKNCSTVKVLETFADMVAEVTRHAIAGVLILQVLWVPLPQSS